MSRRLLLTSGSAAALAGSLLLGAGTAIAAVPAPGQVITVADQSSAQFSGVDPATGALTPIGDGSDFPTITLTGLDVDDTGVGFAVGTAYNSNGADGGYLLSADATTGAVTNLQRVFIDSTSNPTKACLGIETVAGTPWLSCWLPGVVVPVLRNVIGPVDPTTGVLTPQFRFEGPLNQPESTVESIALDPSGQWWAFTAQGNSGPFMYGVYKFGAGAGDDTPPLVAVTNAPVFGADFDRSGQLWASVGVLDGEEPATGVPVGTPAIAIINPSVGSFSDVVRYDSEGVIVPITVWGAAPGASSPTRPVLPATGPEAAGAALVGLALLAVGVGLAALAGRGGRVTRSSP